MSEEWVTALKQGDLVTARQLLALEPDPSSPFEAAATGRLDELTAIPDLPLNEAGPGGWSLLHLAAYFGQLPTVEWLLEQGADPARQTDEGHTAVDLATRKGHTELAKRIASFSA